METDKPIIPAGHYADIKEFCKKIVEKQSEKVVLSKIEQDEYTERAAGGR